MRYIDKSESGGPEVLMLAEGPRPEPGPGEVLIRVAAAGINRPDVMQTERGISAAAGCLAHSRARGCRPNCGSGKGRFGMENRRRCLCADQWRGLRRVCCRAPRTMPAGAVGS